MNITDKMIREKCEALGTTSHKLAKAFLLLEAKVDSTTKSIKILEKVIKDSKVDSTN